jgi:proteic killer suppression protein
VEVEFQDKQLDRLEVDASYGAGWPPAIVKAFRRQMQRIRSARDERDLRALRSNRFEKLKGARRHQYSMRLNDQMRLVFEIQTSQDKKIISIVSIEDYHW